MDRPTFRQLTEEMTHLYSVGKYADALAVTEQHADRFPEQVARITFWRMCLLSICGRSEDVLAVFRRGLDSGLWWGEHQFADTDLDNVRDMPEFQRLMQVSLEKYAQANKAAKPECRLLVPDEYESTLPLLIVLHGGGGNKDSNLEEWDVARRRGWLVLSPQSTNLIFPDAYWWAEDLDQRLRDIQIHFEEISQNYPINESQIVIGGISQGSGMAIHAALSGKIPSRGFISVAIGWPHINEISILAKQPTEVRGIS
jgi:hypothetical protein